MPSVLPIIIADPLRDAHPLLDLEASHHFHLSVLLEGLLGRRLGRLLVDGPLAHRRAQEVVLLGHHLGVQDHRRGVQGRLLGRHPVAGRLVHLLGHHPVVGRLVHLRRGETRPDTMKVRLTTQKHRQRKRLNRRRRPSQSQKVPKVSLLLVSEMFLAGIIVTLYLVGTVVSPSQFTIPVPPGWKVVVTAVGYPNYWMRRLLI